MMPAPLRGRGLLTLAEIAKLTDSQLIGDDQTCRRIGNIATLDMATFGDIGYLDDEKYLSELSATHAGACFVAPRFSAMAPPGVAILVNDDPYGAFVTVARALFPDALRPSALFETSGRPVGAHVHISARIESSVAIDPLALIGPRAQIGGGTLIAAGAMVGPDVCIGRHCAVGSDASIMHALIGDRVIVGPGARLGQDSVGRRSQGKTAKPLPHTRRIIVQDDAEIGANATIDRGSTRDTVIGEGTKIDSLVQIAHNVRIGRHCMIGAQTTIAAGATIGDFTVAGAQVGIAENIAVGDRARVAGRAIIDADVPPGARLGGSAAEQRGGRE